MNKAIAVAAVSAVLLSPTADAIVEGFASRGPNFASIGFTRYPDASTILVQIYGAGVYKSTDSGAHFAQSNHGLPNGNVNVIRNQLSSTVLYAGMDGYGVYKSTDEGANWAPINSGLECGYINHVSVSPINSQTLYAATNCASNTGGGVFRSSDGGASWDLVSGPADFAATPVLRVLVDRVNGTRVWAATSGKGIWRSDSAGDPGTWVQKGFPGGFIQNIYVQINSSTVAVASLPGVGVFVTIDGGDNWVAANTGLPDLNFTGTAGFDENNPNTLYVSYGNRGIYKGTLSGTTVTWTLWNTSLPGVTNIDTSIQVPGALFAVGTTGYYKSIDNGANWTPLQTGLPFTSMNDVQTHPTDPKLIYATNGDAVWKTTDGGINWTRKQVGTIDLQIGRQNQIALDPADPNTLWVSSNSNGIYKSIDGGSTFNPANTGLPPNLLFANATVARAPDGKLYTGFLGPQAYGVYRSDDAGATWNAKNMGLTGNALFIRYIVPNPTTAGTIYAGTGDGFYLSIDNGDNWSKIGPTTGQWRDLAVDPANPTHLYAARFTTGDEDPNFNSGVWKSIDNGTNWNQTGLIYAPAQRIALIRHGPDLVLLAAVWPFETSGLWVSDDDGASWGVFTTGLRNSIRAFDIFPSGTEDFIRVAGHGMGVANFRKHYGADFDRSSMADLFWRHQYDFNYLWLMNGAVASAVVGLDPVLTNNWRVGGIGDIDEDDRADIIWYYAPTATAYAWLMNASGVKPGGVVTIGSVGPGWTIEGIGDFDHDDISDILWRHTSGLVYVWYLNQGGSVRTVQGLGSIDTNWRMAGIADLDNDGAQDIVWIYEPGGTLTGIAYAWLMDDTGAGIKSVVSLGQLAGSTIAKVGDFDGDRKADLFWRNPTTGANEVWYMNGGTVLQKQTMPAVVGSVWQIGAAGDFNADGLMDLVWYYAPSGLIYQWFMNGPNAPPTVVPTGTLGPNWFLPGQ